MVLPNGGVITPAHTVSIDATLIAPTSTSAIGPAGVSNSVATRSLRAKSSGTTRVVSGDTLLSEAKRIEKLTSHDMGDKLTQARDRLREVYRIWDFLEHNPDSTELHMSRSLQLKAGNFRSIISGLSQLGLIKKNSLAEVPRWSLQTRLGQVTRAKCPHCGTGTEAPKAMLLEETSCPHCSKAALFVLVADD